MRDLKAVSAITFSLIALAGCGDSGTLTADEFVDAINESGAEISLGPVLTTNPDGVEIQSVTLTDSAEPSAPAPAEGDVHGSGALLVMADVEEASAELDRCQVAPSLTCFRAANVILRFEGLLPEEQARISAAIESIDKG